MVSIAKGVILSTPQDLTGDWEPLGVGTIEVLGYSFIGIYFDLTINDSKDFQMRARGVYEIDPPEAQEYRVYTETIKKDVIENLEKPQQFPDEDQNGIKEFEMDSVFKFILIEIRALTVGETAGQITLARYRQGYRQ